MTACAAAARVRGMVFDIREFTVHDGPGIRTTVFLKGCHLRCAWCHNPEGLRPEPQTVRGAQGERTVGRAYGAGELVSLLAPQLPLLASADGGITFSGGEPLAQAAFVAAVADLLPGTHLVLDTSAYSPEADFRAVVSRMSLVLLDLKLIDPVLHRHYTGVDNGPILANLRALPRLGVPWRVRVPLIPGITDTADNLAAIAAALRGQDGLAGVELLPYNRAAGAKYGPLAMAWLPPFEEHAAPNPDPRPFVAAGLEVKVRC